MRTVRDDSGDRYLLVKRSSEASLVRDPVTGEERYVENDRLEPAEGETPLETAAGAVSPAVRRILTATHDDRSLGLLVELVDGGPIAVRDLLATYDLCESDMLGLLTEFRAAGLVEEATIAGERGYDATDLAREGVAALRSTRD
ncbi:hypothetical protein [Haloarchaeobius sp. HME9146]|uniref:DUF7346 family protein n=1 Tax=Haloarchaeobius sp. HME9146 TaxID=2978732 RepID=UPI0021C2205E|nr:hypothetical protein [Haloarchaeobius sp. HME9146]MCT9096149.1 hypothetical protein [Haloarchaeobius sp. HME9146]